MLSPSNTHTHIWACVWSRFLCMERVLTDVEVVVWRRHEAENGLGRGGEARGGCICCQDWQDPLHRPNFTLGAIERAKKWGHIFQNGGNRSSSRCDFDKWLLFSLTGRLLFHTGPHAWRSWASVSYFKHKISFALKTVSLSTNRPSVGHKRSSLKLSTGMTVTPEPPTFTHERECFFFYTLKNKCQVELLIWCLGARGYWITDVTNIWLLDVVIVYKGMWISVHYSYL